MEVLFEKKFNFWSLQKAKNYSLLSEKDKPSNFFIVHKKNSIPVKLLKKEISSTDFANISKYYGDIFSNIMVFLYGISLVKNGDRLIFTYFYQYKSRYFGHYGFKKYKTEYKLIVNLKTGDFIIKSAINNKIKYYKNYFFGLNMILDFSGNFIRPYSNFNIMKDYIKELKTKELEDLFCQHLGFKNQNITHSLIDFFVNKKKIKVPNNHYELIKYRYPSMKYLYRNDNKLVLAILDRFNIKTKYIIKKVHENIDKPIDFNTISHYMVLFGNNASHYIKNIPFHLFISNNRDPLDSYGDVFPHYTITSQEKNLIVKTLNDSFNSRYFKFFTYDLYDHLKMREFIRKNGIDFDFQFTTFTEFKNEHIELVNLYNKIIKGFTYYHEYSDELISKVEQIIITNDESFFPFILKHEDEYKEEGKHMHHCVSSYSGNDNSIIISIRKDNSKQRVTCEYDLNGRMVQARYFCNEAVPLNFQESVEILSKRIQKNVSLIKNKQIKKVPILENFKRINN